MARVRIPAGALKRMEKEKLKTRLVKFHDKHYKTLLLVPIVLLLFCFVYLGIFHSQNGDFIHRDISLTGGTSVTIYEPVDSAQLTTALSDKLEGLTVRDVYDIVTREQKALIIETKSDADTTRTLLEDYLGHELNEENSSFEFTGSALSQSFFKQLLVAIILAFVFMAIVVFVIFRTLVPSGAVIISAFADILMTLTIFNLFGMQMSSAGIVAFLMLIGYSVDTDILLTNRVLRRHEHTLNARIYSAFKTGMTMTLTSFFAILFALIIVRSFSPVLSSIFTILVIGLIFDMFNTWVTNASIIKWYALKKHGK